MKLVKKAISLGIASIMMLSLASCGGYSSEQKNKSNLGNQKLRTNHMLHIAESTDENDEKTHYFIDGSGNVKTYKGYWEMENFLNGLSLVEGDGTCKLIDTDEKVVAEYAYIHRVELSEREPEYTYYEFSNDREHYGVLDAYGKVLIEDEYTSYIRNSDSVEDKRNYVIYTEKSDGRTFIFSSDGEELVSYLDGEDYLLADFYNTSIETDRGEQQDFWWSEEGKLFNVIRDENGREMIINEKDEVVFEAEEDAEIEDVDDSVVFYTIREVNGKKQMKVFSSKDFKQINNNIYQEERNLLLFLGDIDTAINSYGDSCDFKYETLENYDEVAGGMVYIKDGSGKYILADASGSGKCVEIKEDWLEFNYLVPCYQVGGTEKYYDYSGKLIIDAETIE